jgi:hypothetical protein
MSSVHQPTLTVLVAVASGFMCLGCGKAKAQTFAPYSTFDQMSLAQLETLQGKLALVGPGLRVISSLGFTATGHTFDASPFAPSYRPEFSQFYDGDYESPRNFTASVADLQALIDSVGTLPGVTDGGVDTSGYLSFALLNELDGDTLVFEAIVDTSNGRQLFAKLLQALAQNPDAVTKLTNMGCVTDMLPAATPRDASDDVAIRVGGVRQDRSTGEFTGTVRVTNTSGQPLGSPLILVLRAEGNVELANADGRTCRVAPAGSSFLNLPIGASLGPGAHVDVVARFDNPDGEPIKFTFMRVFEGQGTR